MSKILTNKEIPHTMTLQGLEYLGHLARTVPKHGLIVEVGPLFGSSTWVLAKNAHPTVRVISIDTWEPQEWIHKIEAKFPGCRPFSKDAFEYYTRDCENITAYQGFSPQILGSWNESIDLFFDDATHGNPGFRESLDFYVPKLKPGGIAAGDDYATGWPDIITEVRSLGRTWKVQPEIIGRVWALMKPNGGTSSVYNKAGPYSEYDINVSVRMSDGEIIDQLPAGWAGRLHVKDEICALKVDWVTPRSDRLSGVYQTMDINKSMSEWAEFGKWIESSSPIRAFRGHLIGSRSNDLNLTYQTCNLVRGKQKRKHNKNTKAFRAGQWTDSQSELQIVGISALRCFVSEGATPVDG
jgi:hypothetical protein